jgi:hypothetical protein
MCDFFIYRDDVYCDECGEKIIAALDTRGKIHSDNYPKGPYSISDSARSSDTPQHCVECHKYIGMKLTATGQTYACNVLCDYVTANRGPLDSDANVLDEWAENLDNYNLDGENAKKLEAYRLLREQERAAKI